MTYLIRQMGHVVIAQPDPRAAAQDLVENVGLRISEVDGDAVYLTSDDRHHEVTYVKVRARRSASGSRRWMRPRWTRLPRGVKADGVTILADAPIGKGYDRAVRLIAPGGALLEAAEIDAAMQHIVDSSPLIDVALFRLCIFAIQRRDMATAEGLRAIMGWPPANYEEPPFDLALMDGIAAAIPYAERVWWARAAWCADTEVNYRAPLYRLLRRRVAS